MLPTISPGDVYRVVASCARAIPKSTIRGPLGPRTTFAGLRSRCTMPAAWIAARAAATAAANASTSRPPNGPARATCSRSEGPGTYSVTRYGDGPSPSAASTRATPGCCTRAAASASRRNRRRYTGSSAYSGRITLTATGVPSTARAR